MAGVTGCHKIGLISLGPEFLDELFYSYFEETYEQFKVQSPHLDVRRIRLGSNRSISEEEREAIEQLDVLVTDSFIFANEHLFQLLGRIRWIQMFTAGVETITRHYSGKSPPKFLLTRNVGFFDQQMIQYVVAQILYRERMFREFESQQKQRMWKKLHSRPLEDLTLGIVGYGSVGRKIAETVSKFEMKVVALVREREVDDDDDDDGDDMRRSKNETGRPDGALIDTTTDLVHLLRSSDYLVSILPNVPSTCGFFDGDVLRHCRHRRSVFLNIGRGNVVRHDTIIAALNEGWLSHAILDVFEAEPLPEDSPLWGRGDVTITPHISGSQFDPKKFVKKTLENYNKFCSGSLTDVVDWSKGY